MSYGKLKLDKNIGKIENKVPDMIKKIREQVPEDIQVLLSMGIKFDIKVDNSDQNNTIIKFTSQNLISILKSPNGNIINVIEKKR